MEHEKGVKMIIEIDTDLLVESFTEDQIKLIYEKGHFSNIDSNDCPYDTKVTTGGSFIVHTSDYSFIEFSEINNIGDWCGEFCGYLEDWCGGNNSSDLYIVLNKTKNGIIDYMNETGFEFSKKQSEEFDNE